MHMREDCGWPREQAIQGDETSHTASRPICETTRRRAVSLACGSERCVTCESHAWTSSCDLADRSPQCPARSHCWHDTCNAGIRGEHMSYKRAVNTNRG